ncbi:hypothetical protein [Paenarthrobacter ilicis]|uniref:hypothetical protein n=1 Tax=Paenarthrobacter ilicis TaxID=43665 RepID=UPI0028D5F456|nr:hypothetical protein [Paenarthrobacter ilicis]
MMEDPKFKVSVYALERRDLVRVSRRRNRWGAEITETGTRLLTGLADVVGSFDQVTDSLTSRLSDPAKRTEQTAVKSDVLPAKSATQEMVDRLSKEGGITFESSETRKYKQLVAVARRKSLVPDDMELIITTHLRTGCTVEMKRRPEWQLVTLNPVAIPERLDMAHDAVAKLVTERTDRLGMDKVTWKRALRLVQGFAAEVEERGYSLSVTSPPPLDYYGRPLGPGRADGHLTVIVGEDRVQLFLSRVPAPSPFETARNSPRVDFIRVRLSGLEPAFWQSEWTEASTVRSEEMLARMLQEIELRAAREADRRLERQRREDEKRRRWEQVRAQAVVKLNENHRAAVLLDQAERFQRVKLFRDYIEAAKSRLGAMDSGPAAEARTWLEWAEAHTDAIDPMLEEIRTPEDPKADAEAIKPFMEGWSPYGHDIGWGRL